jgi:2-polyprenyl-3-methyl-5-hydroxy-6-metoxy-1,4-benzoquinol methylase
LNEVEQLIWNRVRSATRILDYGSGDQALRRKFVEAGYQGEYQTFDVSPEFSTTCTSPDEIDGMFGAVLCLEVLEHMSLAEGLRLRDRLLQWVAPGGWLILSTPNPACILSPFAADETHRHVYPLHDLLTWALAAGMSVEARRVKILPERLTVPMRMRLFTQRVICYLAGVDRADGLLVLARRAPA